MAVSFKMGIGGRRNVEIGKVNHQTRFVYGFVTVELQSGHQVFWQTELSA